MIVELEDITELSISNQEDSQTPIVTRSSLDDEPASEDSQEIKLPVWIYFCFFVLGAGLEFPYNAFLTAYDFFQFLFPDSAIEFVITLAFDPTGLLFLIVMLKYGDRVDLSLRLLFGYGTQITVLFLVPLIAYIFGSSSVTFTALIIGLLLVGCCTAISYHSLLGWVALLPARCTTSVMTGIGVSGFIVALCRVFTKLAFSDDLSGLRAGSLLYFLLAAAWILACLIIFFVLKRMPSLYQKKEQHAEEVVSIWETFKKVKGLFFSEFYCLFLTFICFPGMVTGIRSTNEALNTTAWFPVILLTLHHFMNSMGTMLTHLWAPFKGGKRLWIPVCLRTFFFVFFILCIRPRVIQTDVAPIIVILAFSFSNGFFSSLAATHGPSLLTRPREQELSGQIIGFGFNFGLASGTTAAFLLNLAYLKL